MDVHNALEQVLADRVPDRRTALCEVAVQGGTLTGVADPVLESDLYAFAAAHNLPARVVYPVPTVRRVQLPRVSLTAAPAADGEAVDEALHGEEVRVFDSRGEFARVALLRDGYLGWVPSTALSAQLPEASHRFGWLRGHAFAGPSLRAPRRIELSYGTRLTVLSSEDGWSRVRWRDDSLFVRERALVPLARPAPSFDPERLVRFALRFLEAPYQWGGVTAWGLDCSGLVQTSYGAFGLRLPRDSDQQQLPGREIVRGEITPGDLLFFPGHVAISLGGERFVHANAHHMRVTVDSLGKGDYGRRMEQDLTAIRRPHDA